MATLRKSLRTINNYLSILNLCRSYVIRIKFISVGGVSIVKVEELPDEIQKKYQKQIDQTKPKVLIVETEQQESNFPKNIELTGAKKKSKKKADDEEGEGMALDMSVNTGKGNVSIGTGGKSSSKSAKKSKSSRSSKKSK